MTKKAFVSFMLCCFLITIQVACQDTTSVVIKKDSVVKKITDTYQTDLENCLRKDNMKIINTTFLGNERRNYYGNSTPDKLDIIWKVSLGSGQTHVGAKTLSWSGAGWTGQPLVVWEDSVPYLIQGSYDYHLRKINALNGQIIWKYKFDDVIKGTGTLWVNTKADSIKNRYVLMQGSRLGFGNSVYGSPSVYSFRAISYITGQELWRMNSPKTLCYSRDCDGSPLVYRDTAYIGLETGVFRAFDPNPENAVKSGNFFQPKVYNECMLYDEKDNILHQGNLVTESSACRLGRYVYIASGSGHIYGYNIDKKIIDWDFYTGSDIDGSCVVTNDNCLVVAIEKQYIKGNGGVYKLDPSKDPKDCVVWFFPTKDCRFASWEGGVIGSAAVTDNYMRTDSLPSLAAFIAIDGNLYVVDHSKVDTSVVVIGSDGKSKYHPPKEVFRYATGASISTPIIVKNRIVAATYSGVYLFEFDKNLKFKLLDHLKLGSIEATPFAFNKRIYIACRDGYLYCIGNNGQKRANTPNKTSQNKVNSMKNNTTKNISDKKQNH